MHLLCFLRRAGRTLNKFGGVLGAQVMVNPLVVEIPLPIVVGPNVAPCTNVHSGGHCTAAPEPR
jgi:hypothetical protein